MEMLMEIEEMERIVDEFQAWRAGKRLGRTRVAGFDG